MIENAARFVDVGDISRHDANSLLRRVALVDESDVDMIKALLAAGLRFSRSALTECRQRAYDLGNDGAYDLLSGQA